MSFLGLGSLEAAPVKTIDFADDGNNCERINDKCIAMGSGYISAVSYTHLTLPTKRIV